MRQKGRQKTGTEHHPESEKDKEIVVIVRSIRENKTIIKMYYI